MKINKAVGFVLASMAAGFLSGIANLTFSVPGALMGGALAIGVLACDVWRERKGALPVGATLAVAAAVSLAVSPLVTGWRVMFPSDEIDSNINFAAFAYTGLNCLSISWGVLLYYRSHSLRQGRLLLKGFLFLVMMPSLGLLPRLLLHQRPDSSRDELPGLIWLIVPCIWGGLMLFLLLWGLAAKLFGIFSHRGAEIVGAVREPPSAQGTENCTDIERSDT